MTKTNTDLGKYFHQEFLKLSQQSPWPILTFNVMSKPGGPACNMACGYCYYRHKSDTLHLDDGGAITDALLERFIKQYMDAQINPTVFFTWQGGEPTLMGLDYYRKVLAIQAKYARPQVKIANAFQTNGLLLDDSWCAFLKQNNFRVGLSIDGPVDMHDAFRRTAGGEPTYERVRAAVDRLIAHEVPFNTLTTVSPANVERVDELYDFLTVKLGSRFLQFQPCVERKDYREVAPGFWPADTCPTAGSPQAAPGSPDSVVTDWSISVEQWGPFLCRLFDLWWKDRETVRVNWFDSWASQFAGYPAHMCVSSPVCGRALSMERDGKVYSCDHFVYPEYCMGDLNMDSLSDIVRSVRQRKFAEAKQTTLPAFCKKCPFLLACYGECPKRRFLRTPDGDVGLNYLCAGFRAFFDHAGSRLAEYGQRFRPLNAPVPKRP
jgi:uncharacterized protein